ncbi:unnamed protein product [Symbiodinium natans]|uniref:Uncharacterized protein n=1 Tax=Symbiodinium natans TaxID=878477 RepID=A0A812K8E4_9DINO|nr:unnamed protein product [Symbiodinium natans]
MRVHVPAAEVSKVLDRITLSMLNWWLQGRCAAAWQRGSLAAKVAAVAPDRSERASELHEPHEQHEPQEPHEPHEPQAVQAVQAISVAGSENGDELQKTSPTAPPTTEGLRASSSSQQEDGSQTGEASPNVELDDLGLQLDALTELTELTELGVDLKQEGLEALEADDDGVGMKDPDQLDFENDMEAF